MLTRRRFLSSLPAVAVLPRLTLEPMEAQSFLSRFRTKPVQPPPTFVYFATDTDKGNSRGIYLSRFDANTGQLTVPILAAETRRPAFLALSPRNENRRRTLYAVNEVENASATVTSYHMDPRIGALQKINQVTSAGAGPCYVSVDATGQATFVANYAGSSIASYRVLPSGALSEPVERIDYKQPQFGKRGPNSARQDAPHPHSVHLSPDNRFLLVNDLGSDEISVFSLDPTTARLKDPVLFSNSRPGSGPRHIAFHPNGRWMYSINELDSTIDLYLWTTTSSRTAPQGLLVYTGHFVKTIAPGFPVSKNTAAEVAVAPDGNFVYASNRGEDTLVVFSVSPSDGTLKLVQRIASGGKTPRQFTLDETGRWLICGNQDSANVTVFRREEGTGRLQGPMQSVPIDSVMFTLFA